MKGTTEVIHPLDVYPVGYLTFHIDYPFGHLLSYGVYYLTGQGEKISLCSQKRYKRQKMKTNKTKNKQTGEASSLTVKQDGSPVNLRGIKEFTCLRAAHRQAEGNDELFCLIMLVF
jgi:hypothetical protein